MVCGHREAVRAARGRPVEVPAASRDVFTAPDDSVIIYRVGRR
ncbi:MAG: hypothetical protein ACRDYU_08770 [Actinomycetes bacterium]